MTTGKFLRNHFGLWQRLLCQQGGPAEKDTTKKLWRITLAAILHNFLLWYFLEF